jgi:ABC-type nitrate/sulfonate/bicarbonate transport system substrate-binding protein
MMNAAPMFFIAACLFLGAACTSAPAAGTKGKLASKTSLKYASTGLSWSNSPHVIAIEKKFFEAENLNVELVVAGQSAATCQQVLARAVELGQCSLNDHIQIVEQSGAPLVLVSGDIVTALPYGMMAKPGIKAWTDLKGKIVMVGGPKDNTVYYTRVMARPNGLKDEEYQFQFAGASSARFAALKSGAVDASILTDPFDAQAEADGYVRLGDLLPKYLTADNYSGGGAVALRDWAKDHANELASFSRALRKAIAWIYDPANKDELFAIMQPKLNVSREAFDRSYQKTIIDTRMWSTDGLSKASAVQGVVNSLVELGTLSPPAPDATKYFDNTYVELALSSR